MSTCLRTCLHARVLACRFTYLCATSIHLHIHMAAQTSLHMGVLHSSKNLLTPTSARMSQLSQPKICVRRSCIEVGKCNRIRGKLYDHHFGCGIGWWCTIAIPAPSMRCIGNPSDVIVGIGSCTIVSPASSRRGKCTTAGAAAGCLGNDAELGLSIAGATPIAFTCPFSEGSTKIS